MNTEDYTWVAHYKNHSALTRFECNGKENLFRDILQKALEEFELYIDGNTYSVNLINGEISLNMQRIAFNVVSKDFRLIYFRRVRVEMGSNAPETRHFLGWQTTINNVNKKIIMEINTKGVILHQ